MMSPEKASESEVHKALDEIRDPETGRGLAQMGQVGQVNIDGDTLKVEVALTTHSAVLWDETRNQISEALRQTFPSLKKVEVDIVKHERPPDKIGEIGLTAKSVIAVGSGKGGVGKSTIATSLAYGLSRAGSKVGLMDADVYGPSVPHLIGVNERPEVVDKRIQPIDASGVNVMSMGFLVPPGEAVVWRGPMLHGAITQFLRDTDWGPLDYLIIDLPPGTGDIALTLSQLLPLTGAVVVCTPQDVALLDAAKAIAMFSKVNIPVLGMVENMSYFVCPSCNERYEIFGSGGARRRAEEMNVSFLGEVPINMQIRIRGDEGQAAGVFDDDAVAPPLKSLCYRLVKNLAEQHRSEPPLPSLSVLG